MSHGWRISLKRRWKPAARSGLCLFLAIAGAGSAGCGKRSQAPGSDDIARLRRTAQRIEESTKATGLAMSATHTPLSAAGLPTTIPDAAVKKPANGATSGSAPEQKISFHVTGIVVHEQKPVVLTTSGMAGIGEEVDGFKVVRVEGDAVAFVDKQGKMHLVALKKQEAQQ